MSKLHKCPCCGGQGVIHDLSGDFETLLECVECDGSGRVTREHRDELVEWRQKCRVRPSGRVEHKSDGPARS